VRAAYRAADLFVLASRVDGNGDRDGLPNVLLEALSQGCPVIATAVSAIPELVVDGVTGALAPASDPAAFAAAIVRLARDPALRTRLAAAGEARVRRDFPLARGIDAIAALLEGPQYGDVRSAAHR
jgi:glycosyltransferase involved in cell wall biosynthesis